MSDEIRDHLADGERAGQRYALRLPRALRGQAGVTIGQRAGSSLEFRDYREYQPGDDLRHVDWNAFARSDVLSVKLYREEVTPHLDLFVDNSRSMALEGTAKARATRGLTAFFAVAAANASFTCTPWLLGAGVEPIVNATAPPAQWQGLDFAHRASPLTALQQGGGRWRPRGVRILLSDLLFDGDPLLLLRLLSERAAAVVVVQVLAAVDEQPIAGNNLRLVDAETGEVRELRVDEAALRRYAEALRLHQENWHAACRQTGALFATINAENLVNDWRLDALVAAEVLQLV